MLESGDALNGWIILGIILSLLVALCLLRVGFKAVYSECGLELWANAAMFRFRVYPAREDKKRAAPIKKAKEDVSDEEKEKQEKGGPLELFRKYYDLALDLLKILKKLIRIDMLKVRFVAAAKEDAAKAALLYGKAWAAEGIILAVLENNIRVRKKDIAIHVDYQAEKPTIFCLVKLSASIGGLLLAGLRLAKVLISQKVNEKGGAV